MRVVLVTMDTQVASAIARARVVLTKQIPGLSLRVHAASEFAADPVALQRCLDDIGQGDIIINTIAIVRIIVITLQQPININIKFHPPHPHPPRHPRHDHGPEPSPSYPP